MIALLSALLLLASAELTTIYEDGAFTQTVGLYTPGIENGNTMRVFFNPARCVRSFRVKTLEETPVTITTVVGHEAGSYIWETIGSGVSESEIVLQDAPHCVSRFRVTIGKGPFLGVYSDFELEENKKRAISCTYNANDQWPNTCKSSSAGTMCLNLTSPNYCGCRIDGDCFADVSHPFCDVSGTQNAGDAPGTCVKCQYALGATNPVQQGYACRMRTPSLYYADEGLTTKTQSPGYNLIQNSQGEQIPPDSYFKEICISGDNSGACERCDQASSLNNPDYGYTYPDYSSATPTGDASADNAFQDGLRGSYFCKNIYGSTSPHPQRPICISSGVFSASGLSNVFNNYVLSMEIGYFGTGTPSMAPGAPIPSDPAQKGIDTYRLISEWEGACGPCVLQSAINGGTPIQLHTICSYTQATTPICDSNPTNGCRACATNTDCKLATATCLTDGTGSCTGGNNCQLDGSCHTCASDADCGILDGGEAKMQAKCDTDSTSATFGQCIDAFSCTGNLGEGTAKDCSVTNGGSNCYKDGSCKTCATNSDCGNTDGGTTQNQQVCKLGVCTGCSLNSDCVGTSGANCQADGSCLSCTSNANCAALDGGASAACAGSTTYCPDQSGQTICNLGNNLCESPCLSNNWCSLKKTAQSGITTNNGANCGSSGVCANCQTPGSASVVANSPNCGSVDGPPTGLTGTSGKAGQTSCDTTGICVDPFTCATNADCSGAPAAPYSCTDSTSGSSCANCQTSGSCLPCTVDYTSSTCGSVDGGETPGQINCKQSSRQCVAACTSNAGCTGTQGLNCMANGLCLNCRTDADCQTGNAWGGDLGAQTVCTNSICVDACTSNAICGANSNCNKDGRCTPCTTDADCVSNDGPPPMGTDVKCNAGVCQPPFTCSPASSPADNNDCKTFGGGNNCMADGSCKTCTKDSDCVGDGGFTPNQPKCNTATGVCIECASNGDCLGTGTPLNCDDDGLCRDCRKYTTGIACTNQDGPPATPISRNPNCDSLTGICVDFCTADSDCLDACAPKCNLERGCCVECNTQLDCPVAQWRGSQTSYTYCTGDFICTVPPTAPPSNFVCETDADCSGATPACDFTRQVCVQCMADAHCPSSTPACQFGQRKCVDCTDDTYCRNDLDEDGNPKTCGSDNQCEADSAFLSASLLFALCVLLARFL